MEVIHLPRPREQRSLQAGGAQSQCTRYQVEGIAGTQHHSHEAEQLELRAALAATDHTNATVRTVAR